MTKSNTVLAIGTLMGGCCSNVYFLEHLINMSSNSGNVILFFQYVFTALEGFIIYSRFGKTPRIIPLKSYFALVVMFVVVTVTNIMSLNCNIPIPLHTIFKSGSLVANLIIGSIMLKRSYSFSKYLAVFLLSIGIFICTMATSFSKMSSTASETEKNYSLSLIVIGVILLSISLITSARLGVYQEVLFSQYGKQSREAVYYSHLLPLPLFVLIAPSIIENVKILNASESYPLPFVTQVLSLFTKDHASAAFMASIPILWHYMLANLVTQYICISSVFYLTSVCTSLSVTLLMTLRKFLSLLISVLYFKNEFTPLHWFGACFVFLGTLIYAEIFDFASKRGKEVAASSVATRNGATSHADEQSRDKMKSA